MKHSKTFLRVLFIGLILLGSGVLILWLIFLRPQLPPAERGRRLAEKLGCFACHGPEGIRGTPDPGRSDLTVPTYLGELMMFAAKEEDIREWIRDGLPAGRTKTQSWQKQRQEEAFKMPAFGKRISGKELEYLVEFVKAVNEWTMPEDSLANSGFARAKELGCFGCHGAGGRLSRPNPGSFKGYVASWVGEDFPDLVKNQAEFNEWVNNGISQRFQRNPLARFFLNRAILKMPAFHDHLQPSDLEAIWAYILWLRSKSGSN